MSTFKSIDKGKQRASFKDSTLVLVSFTLQRDLVLAYWKRQQAETTIPYLAFSAADSVAS